jgi:Skp family chaperone for outer membrane proteins
MLRTRTLSIAALAAVLFAPSSFAQSDTTQIGAINLSYVARTSKAGQEGLARIDEAVRKKSLEIEARAAALKKQQSELQKSSIGLSARALADLQRAFEKSRVDLERLQ